MLTMRSPIWRKDTNCPSECGGGRFTSRASDGGYCPAGRVHRVPIVAERRRSRQARDLWGSGSD